MRFSDLLATIEAIDSSARHTAARSVDRLLTLRNWLIGACLVEYEQNGEDRGAYGDRLVEKVASGLRRASQRGVGTRNLKNCRQIALTWPGLDIRQTVSAVFGSETGPAQIRQTVSAESSSGTTTQPDNTGAGLAAASLPVLLLGDRGGLFPSLTERHMRIPRLDWQDDAWLARLFGSLSFSHLLELSRIDDPVRRAFYELECLRSGWSVRELKRQRESMLYERVGLSRDKDAVRAMGAQGILVDTPETIIRDPYVLEFLGLGERAAWTESELEQALIDHLQAFLLELGRDFCFMSRQFRVTVGGRHHYLDLLFFHRGLRCLVAIDLKIGAFRHENAGQMHFYLNCLADEVARPDESPPVGIVLCTDKDEAEVHYATAGLEHSVFVSRYLVQLPSEDELARWLRAERALLEKQTEKKE